MLVVTVWDIPFQFMKLVYVYVYVYVYMYVYVYVYVCMWEITSKNLVHVVKIILKNHKNLNKKN